jgi:hypothetical protein
VRAGRGLTSVLAMLYLVLFATLAIGFYAATNVSNQVTTNDANVAHAFMASESGMDFMRYQLAKVNIPPTTPPDQVLDALYSELQEQLEETGNLGGETIALDGNTIRIPGDPAARIKLDSTGNATFRATVTDWAGEIVVKTDGRYGDTGGAIRAISMDFTRQEHTTTTFDYAVASKGQIVMQKGVVSTVTGVDPAIATMMSSLYSAGAITVSGGTIGGDLNVLEGVSPIVTGGSVGGSSVPSVILANHVHEVEPPIWPTFDTSVYEAYATNTYGSGVPLNNIRIPAGTNPKFTGNKTIQGIMYIESPNEVEFRGNVTLQGFIVFENTGDDTVNSIDFRGNVTQSPLPSGSEYDALRATSGVAILAPTASVTMSGSTDSFLRGNVIVNTFSFAGSADIQIDRGTLMAMKEAANAVVFNGKTVRFTATGKGNAPTAGVSYSTFFAPDPTSYQEVTP